MTAHDRKLLEGFGLPAEAIAKTEEVLRVWEVEVLLVTCAFCRKPCISPDVRRRQFRRKTPPSELFLKVPLGFREHDGEIICWPCDEARFQA